MAKRIATAKEAPPNGITAFKHYLKTENMTAGDVVDAMATRGYSISVDAIYKYMAGTRVPNSVTKRQLAIALDRDMRPLFP